MVEVLRIPIRDFPKDVSDAIRQQVRLFSITIVVERGIRNSYTCAGTLCTVSGTPGILTARHVWEQLKKEKEIRVLAGMASVSLDPCLVGPTVPRLAHRLPDNGAEIPDIAFLQIPESDCRNLKAYGKAFYSVDSRRTDPNVSSYEEQGYWLIYGAPQRRLDPTRGAAPSYLYATTIDQYVQEETWDYFEIHLDIAANPDLPSDLEGFSGGGVWRTDWWINEGATKPETAVPVLKGVNFWQTALRDRKMLAHGPRSIYRSLYKEVSGAGPREKGTL